MAMVKGGILGAMESVDNSSYEMMRKGATI